MCGTKIGSIVAPKNLKWKLKTFPLFICFGLTVFCLVWQIFGSCQTDCLALFLSFREVWNYNHCIKIQFWNIKNTFSFYWEFHQEFLRGMYLTRYFYLVKLNNIIFRWHCWISFYIEQYKLCLKPKILKVTLICESK